MILLLQNVTEKSLQYLQLLLRYPLHQIVTVHCFNSFKSCMQIWQLKKTKNKINHCEKSVQIRSYFWSVVSCIRTEYRKIRNRNKSVFGHFSRREYKTFLQVFLFKPFVNNVENFRSKGIIS